MSKISLLKNFCEKFSNKDFKKQVAILLNLHEKLKSLPYILLCYSVKAILSNSFMLGHLGMTSDQSFCPLHTTLLLNQPHKIEDYTLQPQLFHFSFNGLLVEVNLMIRKLQNCSGVK